ncbi:hypothetical protein HMPREF0326_05668 [Desulfovibrio sp. 3_1_syn3]|nr:hypothetical protein HMPREF0326_05668 [Desulfovibrio sp. 3_1_syn3]
MPCPGRTRAREDNTRTFTARPGSAGRAFFMIENSPLSGEFQKGEAYSCQKEALLCYKKVVLTSVVAKESDNG